MKFFGENQTAIKLLPEQVKKEWSDITLVFDHASPLPTGIDKKKCIVVVDKLDPKAVLALVHATGIHQVVQSSSADFVNEIVSAAHLIEQPLSFFDDPIRFVLHGGMNGTPDSISTEGVQHIFRRQFNSSTEKSATLGAFKEFFEKIPRSKTIQSDLLVIADELFTNAVFNAPNQKSEVSRTKAVQLGSEKKCVLFSFYTKNRVVVGVEDPFGSLKPETIIDRLKSCYEKGVAPSIRMGAGGAGIGSYMVFDLSTSYYCCVDAGCKTLVCVTLPLGVSGRAKEKLPKNFHMFIKSK